MPRKYKRKSSRREWSDIALISAMRDVEEGTLSCNAAAGTYDIPEPTLRRYLKKKMEGVDLPQHAGRFKNTFNTEQTQEFVRYIQECNARGLGLTLIQVQKLAFEYAETNGIEHRFNKQNKMAGIDWVRQFRAENNLSLRNPEPTSIARLRGFNKVAVEKFFNILKDVRLKYELPPERIYNADESGVSTVPTKLPKIITPTGQRRVAKIVSAERGRNTTVVCAMNAVGSYVPPFFIFARHRMKPELLHGCPPGADALAQPSGWMTSDSFLAYLKHFARHTHPSKDKPLLLIVDNHSSHISLGSINYCRDTGIILAGLPPHTSHRLQPLDVSFFGPLKSFYGQMCDAFLVNHPGCQITDRNLGPLFREAYSRAATVNNALKGFKACGIEPFNPLIFDDSDFAPAITTERENPSGETEVPIEKNRSDGPEKVVTRKRNIVDSSSEEDQDDSIPLSVLSYKIKSTSTPEERGVAAESSSGKVFETAKEASKKKLFSIDDQAGSSCLDKSLWDLRPIATCDRSGKSQVRKKMSASIISSTPMKEELELKKQLMEEKENKRKLKVSTSVTKKPKDVKNKPKKKPNKERDDIKTKSKDASSEESKQKYYCLGCGELYVDPPTENWVQCTGCLEWWHDKCSRFEGSGDFKCDFCD